MQEALSKNIKRLVAVVVLLVCVFFCGYFISAAFSGDDAAATENALVVQGQDDPAITSSPVVEGQDAAAEGETVIEDTANPMASGAELRASANSTADRLLTGITWTAIVAVVLLLAIIASRFKVHRRRRE